MRPRHSTLAILLIAGMGSAHAADLEAARDAIRRHEYGRAIELLQPGSDAGDAEASFLLSQLLRFGHGTARNLARACQLLESSAVTGHARAAGSLASMIETGECKTSSRTPEDWRAIARNAGYAPPAASTSQPAERETPTDAFLLRAARAGELPELRRLLGALPVDVKDEFGRTPLMLAVEAGKLDAARELIGHGASLAVADRSGETPLLVAARIGSRDLVGLLLDAGAAVDQGNRLAMTPLMVAARTGARELCERLLAAGADAGIRDAEGLRAGDHAALGGHPELAARLGVVDRRPQVGPARVSVLNAGLTPLMIAAESGDMKALRVRLAANDDVDVRDEQGTTALAYAARAGREEALNALLDAHAAIEVRDAAGWTPLAQAVRAGQSRTALALLRAGADVRSPQVDGKPILLVAIESGHADLLSLLLQARADPNVGDKSGTTPLMAAATSDDVAAIASLMAAGAKPDLVDRHGNHALWLAASRNAHRAVTALAPRSSLNLENEQGTTALIIASSKGFLETVNALLAAGADARKVSANRTSALHAASAGGRAALIPRLLSAKVPIDGQNAHGDTPLHLAVRSRCLDCARALIASGASRNIRNADGLSARDVARLSRDKALAQLFD